jgi:hypothetical protein
VKAITACRSLKACCTVAQHARMAGEEVDPVPGQQGEPVARRGDRDVLQNPARRVLPAFDKVADRDGTPLSRSVRALRSRAACDSRATGRPAGSVPSTWRQLRSTCAMAKLGPSAMAFAVSATGSPR